MKVTVTGSLGYVSTPLIQELINKGHLVTVISSSTDKKNAIEKLGAIAAIGRMEDVDFLVNTFTGADAVYCMLAPYGNFSDPNNTSDVVIARANLVANNYVEAINKSGVKRVVYLSSIGADMKTDNGLIIVHHNAENTLNSLPSEVSISFLRPAGFYKNLYAFVNLIKDQDIISAGYAGDDKNILVSPIDIASAIVEELESQVSGRKVRYVASEELTCNEAAGILGNAVGKPGLKWISVSDKQQLDSYTAHGMNSSLAAKFIEMNTSIHNGTFYEDYNRNKPALGKSKLGEFAKEFAAVYYQQ